MTEIDLHAMNIDRIDDFDMVRKLNILIFKNLQYTHKQRMDCWWQVDNPNLIFKAVAVSVLLSGYTTSTITKYLEKKQGCCVWFWTNSRNSTPQNSSCAVADLSSQTIQDEKDILDTAR